MGIVEKALCYVLGHDQTVYDQAKDVYKCSSCDTVLEEGSRRNSRFMYPLPLPPTRHVTREAPKSCEPLEGPVQRIKREGPPRE